MVFEKIGCNGSLRGMTMHKKDEGEKEEGEVLLLLLLLRFVSRDVCDMGCIVLHVV